MKKLLLGVVLLLTGCKYVPPPGPSNSGLRNDARPAQQQGGGYGEEREGRRRSRRDRRGDEEQASGQTNAGEPGQAPGQRSSRQKRGRPEDQAVAGQFDFYLLNLSWSPEFCATHNSPECGRGLGFVVHGLWPQDFTGDYPENCSDAPGPANPGADADIYPTASLVEHEWTTHGTCSGLSADGYFAAVHHAFSEVQLPVLSDGSTPDAMLSQMAASNPGFPAGSFALSCGNNRLTAIEICMDKNLRPIACQAVRSCHAQVVKVTPR